MTADRKTCKKHRAEKSDAFYFAKYYPVSRLRISNRMARSRRDTCT